MQKVILDTNVLISAFIQRSYPYFIINHLVVEDKITLCISDDVLYEYYDVINRPKFSKYTNFLISAENTLNLILLKSEKYYPRIKLDIISDLDDNKFLELADECNADYLITGDTNDFTIKLYKKSLIVTPREYWEQTGSQL